MMGVAPHIDLEKSVSQAPVSAVNSISIHSVFDGLTGLKLALLASVWSSTLSDGLTALVMLVLLHWPSDPVSVPRLS